MVRASRRASPVAGGTYRFGFAMTTSLGNAVVVDNLRKYVARDASVDAEWAPISHWIDPDPYRRLPGPLHTQAVLNAETAALRRRWTQMDAAVVHSFQMFAYLATFKRFGRRSPLLAISQDYAPIADRDFLRSVGQSPPDGPLHDLRVSVQRAYVRRADLVLARTGWARDGFLTECRVPPEKLHLVHHGVDLEVWGDARRAERTGPVRILFVGGDFQRKGGGLLLDVFTKRFAGAAQLHLLTGTPPPQPPPGVFVHERKAPNSPQLRALYESCDMFVLPSHGDYSPLALMEAMACRLPVVSTPVGGIPEICENGRTGYLVPAGDGAALAAALDRLVSDTDLRRRMGAAGRERVESRFSAQGNTELMLDILKSAVDQRRRTEEGRRSPMTIQDILREGGASGRSAVAEGPGIAPFEISRRRREDKAIARVAARRGGALIERPVPLSRSPLVSVVIPCYNYGHFLEDCARSVLSQTGVRTEVIIVDDASPDGSGEVAERLADADDRIAVIRHRTNKGHIATYNEGIEAVSGEYQLLLSADDLLVPGSLARAAALMEAHAGVAMVYGRAISFGGAPLPTPRTAVTYWAVWPGAVWLRRRFELGQNTVFTPTAVLRTSVQRSLGGYLPELPHAGDLEMWLRFATAGDVGFVGGAEQAYYRVHGSNMSATTYAGGESDILQRHQAFSAVLPRMPQDLARGLAPLAEGALAARALELAGESRRAGDRTSFASFVRLALAVDPDCHLLPEWRALTAHPVTSLSPLGLGGRAARKLANHLMWEQTHWYGG